MNERIYRWNIPKNIKKPEHKVRDISPMQKSTFPIPSAKVINFLQTNKDFIVFLTKLQKINGQTPKNRN